MTAAFPAQHAAQNTLPRSAAAPTRKRGRRWRALWQPLLRLSLGFCLGLFPTVFGACGGAELLEGQAYAKPKPRPTPKSLDYYYFNVPFPPGTRTIPSNSLQDRWALMYVFGVNEEEADALNTKVTWTRYAPVTQASLQRGFFSVRLVTGYYEDTMLILHGRREAASPQKPGNPSGNGGASLLPVAQKIWQEQGRQAQKRRTRRETVPQILARLEKRQAELKAQQQKAPAAATPAPADKPAATPAPADKPAATPAPAGPPAAGPDVATTPSGDKPSAAATGSPAGAPSPSGPADPTSLGSSTAQEASSQEDALPADIQAWMQTRPPAPPTDPATAAARAEKTRRILALLQRMTPAERALQFKLGLTTQDLDAMESFLQAVLELNAQQRAERARNAQLALSDQQQLQAETQRRWDDATGADWAAFQKLSPADRAARLASFRHATTLSHLSYTANHLGQAMGHDSGAVERELSEFARDADDASLDGHARAGAWLHMLSININKALVVLAVGLSVAAIVIAVASNPAGWVALLAAAGAGLAGVGAFVAGGAVLAATVDVVSSWQYGTACDGAQTEAAARRTCERSATVLTSSVFNLALSIAMIALSKFAKFPRVRAAIAKVAAPLGTAEAYAAWLGASPAQIVGYYKELVRDFLKTAIPAAELDIVQLMRVTTADEFRQYLAAQSSNLASKVSGAAELNKMLEGTKTAEGNAMLLSVLERVKETAKDLPEKMNRLGDRIVAQTEAKLAGLKDAATPEAAQKILNDIVASNEKDIAGALSTGVRDEIKQDLVRGQAVLQQQAAARTAAPVQPALVASAGGGEKPPAGPTQVGTVQGTGPATAPERPTPAATPESPAPTAAPERPISAAPLAEGVATDLLPALPEDLKALRASLVPEDQIRFDIKMRRIVQRSPWNPEHEQTLRAYLKNLEKNGSVSEGLRGDSSLDPTKQSALPPPARSPFGEPAAIAELPVLENQGALLLQSMDPKQSPFQPKGIENLRDRVKYALEKSEAFVKMKRGESATTEATLRGTRGNLKGIETEWERAQAGHKAGTDVTEVSRDVKEVINGEEYNINIDVIEKGGRRWVEVKAGAPPFVGSQAETDLLKQVQSMLDVANDPRFHVGGAPPEVMVSFASGEVSLSLKATLDRLRVRIEIRSQGILP